MNLFIKKENETLLKLKFYDNIYFYYKETKNS